MRPRRIRGAAEPLPVLSIVFHDRLPSRDAGAGFEAAFRIHWRTKVPDSAEELLGWPAGRLVRSRADAVLRDWSVLRLAAAEHELAAVLADELPTPVSGGEVLDASVRLSAQGYAVQAAQEQEQARSEWALDEQARRRARANYRFLMDEVLADPASARLYPLLGQDSRRPLLPTGDELAAILQDVDRWRPDNQWVALAQVLHEWVCRLDQDGAEELLRLLQRVAATTGHTDIATRIPISGGNS